MASLTETAYVARRGIKFGAVGLVAVIVLWFAGTGFISWWQATHPAPEPAPAAEFGLLKPIVWPKSTKKAEYELQTPDGTTGRFTDRMKVFFVPEKKSSFADVDKATEIARKFDFLFEPTQLNSKTYRWTNQDPIPQSLEVNIVTHSFTLKKQWSADPTLVTQKKFTSDKEEIMDAQSVLRAAQLLSPDLSGNERVSYWRAQGSKLVTAVSLSEADFVRVDFYRKPWEEKGLSSKTGTSYSFMPMSPERGLAYVLLAGSSDTKKRVLEIDYQYHAVEYSTVGTYPIKTSQEAFDELKAGGGYLASFEGKSTAVIRRVSLGYLDSVDNRYTMPVYIFTGDDQLVAMVSAIRTDMVSN